MQDRKQAKLIARVATLERMLFELRSNQVKKVNWAGLQVDGTGASGVISGANGALLGVSGIDSLNNFSHKQLVNFATLTTSSTTFVDVSGSSMATLTLADTTYVLIYLLIGGYDDTTPGFFLTVQYTDGATVLQDIAVTGNWQTVTTQDPGTLVVDTSYTVSTQYASFLQFVQLNPGAHNFKLQMKVDPGSTTGFLNDYVMGYIVFGT